jgi:hypothetical protein
MAREDHAAAIRQEADRLYRMALIQEPDRSQLHHHADALAAERDRLASERDRLRSYVQVLEGRLEEASLWTRREIVACRPGYGVDDLL